MINQFRKYYFEDSEIEWHENKIGTYHVSSIGNSHSGLNPQDFSGPCLRETYFQYIDPIENDDKSEGNFHMGRILHREIQELYKENVPNSVIEFPIIIQYKKDILIKGSVDIIDFDIPAVVDIKSASLFTFPSSEYDYNPTYLSQVKIYTSLLQLYIFKETYFLPTLLRIVYTKKHNLETIEMDIDADWEERQNAYEDFFERVEYLDECLRKKEVPKAEVHHWCKFCPRLAYCKEEGDIIETKKKGRYILNEENDI